MMVMIASGKIVCRSLTGRKSRTAQFILAADTSLDGDRRRSATIAFRSMMVRRQADRRSRPSTARDD